MSESRTIIAEDASRLANVRPGDVLREDFLIGSAIAPDEVARGTGLSAEHLDALLDGTVAVDAEADLRLSRYFGMLEGFFLGLQHDHDLDEARERHRGALARIVRRAA